MTEPNTTPDLQTILSNLAQFAAPTPTNNPIHGSNRVSTPEGRRPSSSDRSSLKATPQTRSTASPNPVIRDPATITTWQEGLRCVTKLAAQNGHFAASIRRMMDDQRKSEMRWYAERQNLKQAQANRSQSATQAQSILQSLGNGATTSPIPATSAADHEAELANFDRKIYAAQLEMEESMITELKGLGVPFFGTDRALVVEDRDEGLSRRKDDERPKWSPVVTETQLLELRRRMVGHLEDLYRD